ncbi:protein methylesterase [Aureococcus anophagefferens]|nr:protein methylesterase [Aureococcus anophagefferens]
MAHLFASRCVAVAAFATSSHALSDARIPLASSINAKKPTSVLVHGLDSSKETWTSTLAALQSKNYPCLALDLRGHGESPLGAVDEFSSEALARDVVAAVEARGVAKPWVLAALLAHYDDAGRVESWVGKRLREQPDGTWWSDVNPRAQALAKKHVLSSADGSKAWSALAAADLPFEVHLWVAGRDGTVAQWDGADGIGDLAAPRACPRRGCDCSLKKVGWWVEFENR